MTRFALTIEYEGSLFVGLQRQAEHPSVQQHIEEAAFAVTGEETILFAAGRTDSGVHARAMRGHIEIEKDISPFRLMEALNAKLRPHPIAILDCQIVDDEWHARFSCIGRRYCYHIVNRRAPLTFLKNQAWQIAKKLDEAAMHDAAQLLLGRHDFTTFRSAHCQAKSPIKTLDYISVTRQGDDVKIHVAARSFLHHQVRSIVGCLTLVGLERWSKDDFHNALLACDRQALGLNAPSDGLYFLYAIYEGEKEYAPFIGITTS